MADETTEIKKDQSVSTDKSQSLQDDPEAKYLALVEENKKLARDRDNYRSATLALKGKKEIEDLDLTDPAQVSAYITKSIEATLLEKEQERAEKNVDAYALELARKNKELTFALANRATSTATGSGSSSALPDVTSSYWSPEQTAHFKKLGWTDEKIKKAEENAKRSSPGGVV